MSFAIKKDGDIIVVDVEGQLIVGNRQELKQKVLDELEQIVGEFGVPPKEGRDAEAMQNTTATRRPRCGPMTGCLPEVPGKPLPRRRHCSS